MKLALLSFIIIEIKETRVVQKKKQKKRFNLLNNNFYGFTFGLLTIIFCKKKKLFDKNKNNKKFNNKK